MWRAYLSAPASLGRPAVQARDRIGKGPWTNAMGERVAASVEDLHSDDNNLTVETVLTEKGTKVGPGRHDILTGSKVDQLRWRRRDGRTSQPQRRRPAPDVVELGAPVERVQPARSARIAGRRTVVLFRR
jgi:hypothetical protein